MVLFNHEYIDIAHICEQFLSDQNKLMTPNLMSLCGLYLYDHLLFYHIILCNFYNFYNLLLIVFLSIKIVAPKKGFIVPEWQGLM